ncbi:MAG: peptidoglycan D,D-transpeptidase FtsI family protein [Planctomycetota bacterium]|jgi:cell division protein FtsI/penicillin-binding protein 2
MSQSSRNTSANNDTVSFGRLNLLYALLLIGLALLGVRLTTMLRQGQAAAALLARSQQVKIVPVAARPGSIWARNRWTYRLLAGSRQAPGCFVDPALIAEEDMAAVIGDISEALGQTPEVVRETIETRREQRFAWIKHDLTAEESESIEGLSWQAVGIQHEWRREYPNEALGATVLGYRRRDNEPGGGLELSQQHRLAATDGRDVLLADASRRPIWLADEESTQPKDGHSVYLTIDVAVQAYLDEAVGKAVSTFDAKWGAGVVVEPATGRILAMSSAPTFDPNEYSTASAESRNNRAITAPYEPGSVAKPLFAAAAVDAGVATYRTLIDCENGTYRARRGGKITDHGKRYGEMSLEDVVVYSSNIGMAKVGERLGNERLHAAAVRFGFGAKSGIELPGETGGIIRPLAKWNGYSLRRVPFGQEMAASTLQLAMAFSSLTNGGLLLRPQLIDHVRSPSGKVTWRGERQVVRRVLSPMVAAETLDVLEQVVQRGTGKACRLDNWRAFGKTGTAQIPGPGGYVDDAYVGSFVGGAPTRSPRLVCVISIYWPDKAKGYYGGTVAAPYVREVLERTLTYLKVPADSPSELAEATRR